MAVSVDWVTDYGRRSSVDSMLGFTKRAAKYDSGLCLVCGRRATGRCSQCAIATFCGPQCQEAAHSTHSGATTGQGSCCTVCDNCEGCCRGRRFLATCAPYHFLTELVLSYNDSSIGRSRLRALALPRLSAPSGACSGKPLGILHSKTSHSNPKT